MKPRTITLVVGICAVLLGCGAKEPAIAPTAQTQTLAQSPVATQQPEPQGIALTASSRLVLVDAARGRQLLGQRDQFVAAMTAFDRQARLGSKSSVDEATFLAHVRKNVLSWDDQARAQVESATRTLADALRDAKLSLPLPPTIELILTTGDEEVPGTAYTRGKAIIFSRGAVNAKMSGLLSHELFHVLTRNAPTLRDRLYATIGFHPIAPLQLPPALQERRATNPDAPIVGHAIRVKFAGRELLATPVIMTQRPYSGGTLFEYIAPTMYALDDHGALLLEKGEPLAFGFGQAEGLLEQVGRNTMYLIHPEEILAENFRLLVSKPDSVSSPEVLARMRAVLGG